MSHTTYSKPAWLRIIVLSAIAGLLYFSWPLGFILNPSATNGLASNLEALHQPYNWLFALLDILSGLLTVVVAGLLLRAVRHRAWLIVWSIIGLAGFGILTAVDAVLPLNCVPHLQQCPPILEDPFFILHGIVSIGSIGFMTLSIFGLWWLLANRPDVSRAVRYGLHAIVIVWLSFGIITLGLILQDADSALSQRVFIGVCSLWTACLPFLIWTVLKVNHSVSKKST